MITIKKRKVVGKVVWHRTLDVFMGLIVLWYNIQVEEAGWSDNKNKFEIGKKRSVQINSAS